MARDIKDIKKDRMRYNNNSTSATLAYIAILFNVFYFVSIYQVDIGNYYYNIHTGVSIICNLLFLLIAFLSSEGLKTYKLSYAYVILAMGAFQILRIFDIPMKAHNTIITLEGVEVQVMDDSQWYYVLICLIVSAVACFAAGGIGLYKTITLRNYEKENGLA